ncbi:MAG: DNA repair protein RadA [Bacteroidales bacterium]|nr:DNA repair protein RadA [Bacteroidales bacterium]
MPKSKTAFFCRNCGAQSPKWIGRCPACGEWNSYEEEVVKIEGKTVRREDGKRSHQPVRVHEIRGDEGKRRSTLNGELDRVLGGGLVPGSLILVGGEPGIGKSTLLLQIALQMKDQKILYVTGEESALQIRMRADRVGMKNQDCFILTETNTEVILQHLDEIEPSLVIIDSIQTLQTDIIDSSAGSISQIRECAAEMQRYAKTTAVPVILIGHITKDGSLAGPKILEHMVDTVLHFEGDRNYGYRILRAVKNRFGPASELGIYEMHDNGLREVKNPSEILISQRDEAVSGVAIAASVEGLRPMLIEIQALVSTAAYGTPQRSATGFDVRRMNMLLAVLEKRSGFRLGAKDVFLNIAGGLKVDDPAIDLAVVAAILSSNADISIDQKTCFAAEVGLSGEIRAVSRVEQRVAEAEKLGFERIVVSKFNKKSLNQRKSTIGIVFTGSISDVVKSIF